MPSETGLVAKKTVSWVSIMLQSELQGEQQQEQTERVPDNYPHRPPPLSGRRKHTQSNVGEPEKGADMTAHSLLT